MIKVKAKYIKYAYPFAAKEDVRFYLKGIYVEPHPKKGALIKATDGHIAAIFYDEEGICDEAPAIIRVDQETIDSCLSTDLTERFLIVQEMREEKSLSICDHRNIKLFIQPGDCIIDGKYPSMAQIIPPKEKLKPGLSTGLFDARLLSVLNFSGAQRSVCFFHQENPESALVIRIERIPEFIGFLMPMRVNPIDPLPSWL